MVSNHERIDDLNKLNDKKIFSFFYERACRTYETIYLTDKLRRFLFSDLGARSANREEAIINKLASNDIDALTIFSNCGKLSFVYYRSLFQSFNVSKGYRISILPEAYGFSEKEKSSHDLVVQYVNANIAHQDATCFSHDSKQICHNEEKNSNEKKEKKNSYGRHQYENLEIQGKDCLLFCDIMPNILELAPLMPKIIAQIRDVYKSKFKEDMPELFSR